MIHKQTLFPRGFAALLIAASLAGLSVSSAWSGEHQDGPASGAKPPQQVAVMLESFCVDCHQGSGAEGGLDLQALAEDPALATTDGVPADGKPADREPASEEPANEGHALLQWVQVFDRVRSEEMPPPDSVTMPQEKRRKLLDSLGTWIRSRQLAQIKQRGRVQFRRLNRVEYEYTLRDLLKLPQLDVAGMLPPDAEAHGFDNVGEALRVSYVQMARYLDASRAALNQAAWLAPEIRSYEFRLPFPEIHRFRITKDRTTIGDESVLLRQPNTAQTPWRIDAVEIPFPGRHTIRIRGRAATYQQTEEDETGEGELLPSESPQIVSVYQGTRILGSIDLTAEPQTQEITAWLKPNEMLYLYVPTLDDWNPKWNKGAYTGPAVALKWIEFSGPKDVSWPKESYRVLFDDLPVKQWTEDSGIRPPEELGQVKKGKRFPKLEFPDRRNRYMVVSDDPVKDARRLLERFLTQALRRPVPEGEVDRYLELVRADLEKNKPFHEALITGYTAILSSPDFLYFFESPGELSDHALASRLSYFLWRSMPDGELREIARRGELSNEDALRSQVDRMLSDPKSERFVKDFTGQWLGLRAIRETQPDEKLYPEFDDFLLESMVAETHAFFTEMVQQNLPAASVVDSDFTFVNNVLADLYDLPEVQGVTLRKRSLPEDSPRGGLLTQASVLKITANGTTTSPVTRGAWVLDHLLGTPAPPPPPDVPAIDPDTRGAKTIRELLAKHRADPACAGCHAKIDPPGFALESFNVIGGWRERYRSRDHGDKVRVEVDGRPVSYKVAQHVDPSGELEDGREFADIHEFKRLLLENERQTARNLTQRLIVFATGAGISFADRVTVEHILDETEADGYRVRDLIHQVIASNLFRRK